MIMVRRERDQHFDEREPRRLYSRVTSLICGRAILRVHRVTKSVLKVTLVRLLRSNGKNVHNAPHEDRSKRRSKEHVGLLTRLVDDDVEACFPCR